MTRVNDWSLAEQANTGDCPAVASGLTVEFLLVALLPVTRHEVGLDVRLEAN